MSMCYDQGLGKPWRNMEVRLPSSCPLSTTSSEAFLNSFIWKHTSCTQTHMHTPTRSYSDTLTQVRGLLKRTNRHIYDL